MTTVQSFDHSMIERYFKVKSLKYLRDSDGDFLVQFGYDQDSGCEIKVYFITGGARGYVYAIRINSDKRIDKKDWGRAVMLCNTWNKERRWPKAHLNVRNPETDTIGTIELGHDIDLEQGIHQELFNDLTDTIVASGFSFWVWAHQEQGL